MLNRVELKHFKCFEDTCLPLAPLTVLTGYNGSGKSTVIQALLLLSQTILENESATRLSLNGSLTSLGSVSDVVNQLSGRTTCDIGIGSSDAQCIWTFFGDRSDLSMGIKVASINNDDDLEPNQLRNFLPVSATSSSKELLKCLKGLSYITAERLGPRDVYQLRDRHEVPNVGSKGEYAPSLLSQYSDYNVNGDLCIEGIPPTLIHQVSQRMRHFFPGSGVDVTQVPKTNSVVLSFRTSPSSDYQRPTNVGFGLTQLFPIIVAALTAKPDDILIVENPEVHLHPAGQALVGQFLATVSKGGIQVIVETHSDHVLNGIRRAIRSSSVLSENVIVHFFSLNGEGKAHVTSPQIDNHGNFDHWPAGFFDQYDKDASYFAGWGV